jgi:diadenosine tetraphosphatase ApaH/serine/threonine PP2A family protein phosphatase
VKIQDLTWHPCVWGPLVAVLVISIKIENVNRRVRRAARATRVHMLDMCVRVRRACLAMSKLFIY